MREETDGTAGCSMEGLRELGTLLGRCWHAVGALPERCKGRCRRPGQRHLNVRMSEACRRGKVYLRNKEMPGKKELIEDKQDESLVMEEEMAAGSGGEADIREWEG